MVLVRLLTATPLAHARVLTRPTLHLARSWSTLRRKHALPFRPLRFSQFPIAFGVSGQRLYQTTPVTSHGHAQIPPEGEGLTLNFITPEGEKRTVRCYEGDSILEIAHANNVDLEGACEASLACSTCHVILEDKYFDMLEEPSDEENDMLDLAFGLTETSRLGCQVRMTKDMDGMTVRMPSATRNMAVDGFKPKPH